MKRFASLCIILSLLIVPFVFADRIRTSGGGGGAGAGGAPTDADYLVGTANGDLSAEIIAGTVPGGQLGNTWASPTIDDLFIKLGGDVATAGTYDFTGAVLRSADPINLTDVVNLDTLFDNVGIILNYWFGNQTLDLTLTDSETPKNETPSSDDETLTDITFKSSVADTPTPFTIKAGGILVIHFNALVDGTAAVFDEQLYCVFGYADDDSQNFQQVGSNSDSTTVLTISKTPYTLHVHVASDTVVPTGKILWLKFVADASGTGPGYPQISVYYDETTNHMGIGVAGGVLGNFVKRDGTTPMTANWDIGNFDITLKALTGDGTIEGATITEGGNAVFNTTEAATFTTTIAVGNGTTSAGTIQIDEDDDDGSNFASFTVPALAANTAYTLPNAIGGAGEQLTDAGGDGTLSWAAPGTGGATAALDNLASVQINTTLLSDGADTDSLGTTGAEWLNLYIGDAGKIYLGLGQDATIERSAANEMTLTASSGVTIESVKMDGGVVTGATLAAANNVIEADTVITIAGLAPDTATTQATQGNITAAANLVTVGTIGTGVWNAGAVTSSGAVIASGGGLTAGGSGADGVLTIYDDDAGGDTTVVIQALDNGANDYTLTLPPDDGDANEVLKTDGSGVLDWTTAGTGDVTGVGDCAAGACLDGTSDGGTEIALFDGDANKTTISVADAGGDLLFTLPADDGDNLDVLTTDGSGALSWAAGGGADTNAIRPIKFAAGSTAPLKPVTVPSSGTVDGVGALGKDTDTNEEIFYIAFDDTADEYRKLPKFQVPTDVTAAGNVTIRIRGYAATAAADDVAFVFAWHEVADTEDWDGALTEELCTTTLTNTQDVMDECTKADESSSDMGWAADDEIISYIGRDGDHATDDALSGDFHLLSISIEIPRS